MNTLQTHLEKELARFRPYLERFNVSGPRYTSYPTAPQFTEAFTGKEYQEAIAKANADRPDVPLSLYCHLPFCQERCTFCGCYVIISKDRSITEPYLDHLKKEIDLAFALIPKGKTVEQFQFGGGTPTYLAPGQLTDLFNHIRQYVTFSKTAEISVEVDPRDTRDEHLNTLVDLGFNRFSMGVQDFTPVVQEAVNRHQPFEITAHMVEVLRSRGIQYINLDLIYGLPYQTPEGFLESVDKVISLKPTRLAVYSYAHVPWMKGHQKKLNEIPLPEGEAKFSLFLMARERFREAGYVPIGMDHFALPEDELYKALQTRTLHRNFMGYTTKKGCDLYGFGVSAISSVGTVYAQNEKKLPHFYKSIEDGILPTQRGLQLTKDDEIRRDLIIHLFCNFHVDIPEFETRWGIVFRDYFAKALETLRSYAGQNLVEVDAKEIEVGEMGKFFIRNICLAFDQYYQSEQSQMRYSKTI